MALESRNSETFERHFTFIFVLYRIERDVLCTCYTKRIGILRTDYTHRVKRAAHLHLFTIELVRAVRQHFVHTVGVRKRHEAEAPEKQRKRKSVQLDSFYNHFKILECEPIHMKNKKIKPN